MTRKKQDKTVKSAAVELHDAALDRAAGGFYPLPKPVRLLETRTIKGGASDTLMTGLTATPVTPPDGT